MGKPPAVRRAEVKNVTDLERVRQYLPQNYRADRVNGEGPIIIHGKDNAGWTLDGYVLPRLGSGLIVAVEVSA